MCKCKPGEKFLRLIGECQLRIVQLKYHRLSSINSNLQLKPSEAQKQKLILKLLSTTNIMLASMNKKVCAPFSYFAHSNITINNWRDISYPIPIFERPRAISELSDLNLRLLKWLVSSYKINFSGTPPNYRPLSKLHFYVYLINKCLITITKVITHIEN